MCICKNSKVAGRQLPDAGTLLQTAGYVLPGNRKPVPGELVTTTI